MSGVVVLCHPGPARLSARSASQILRHRGPDGAGYRAVHGHGCLFEFGQMHLGARRGTTAGVQPLRSADQRWIIVLDGTIHNDAMLRDYLQHRYRIALRGHGHAETLIELIAHDGVLSTLERIDGQFALVALDRASGTLYAARDGFGIKPLYHIAESRSIGFASEARALVAHGFDAGEPDPDLLASWLRLGHLPSDRSARTRLRRVPAGTLVSWHGGRLTQRAFRYKATPAADLTIATDAVSRYGALLGRSVRDRVPAQGSPGVLLSGGLDSVVLAATLQRAGVQAPCFTVGFAGGASPIDAAAASARALGLPHRPLVLGIDDLIAADGPAASHLEEPPGTPAALALWQLCRFARSEVGVAFTGLGVDETLGGFRRHRAEALRSRLPGSVQRMFTATAPNAGPRDGRLGTAQRALQLLGHTDWLTAYVAAREVFGSDEIAGFGAGEGIPPLRVYMPGLRRLNRLAAGRSDLFRSLWLDTRTRLADDKLPGLDAIAMAHSLAVQLPYLAAPLVDFVEAAEDNARVTPRESKRLLQAWARRHLPDTILRSTGHGLRTPNLFRQRRFLEESRQRVAFQLGSQLGWRIDPLIATLNRGVRGGAAATRAWHLHALARWMEPIMASQAATLPLHATEGASPGVDAGLAH